MYRFGLDYSLARWRSRRPLSCDKLPSISRRGVIGCVGLAVAVLGISSSVHADGDRSSVEVLDEVVVSASRAQLPARAVGSAVTVITREDLERGQIRRVAEVLQDVPGVRVTQTTPGQVTQVSIRGSRNNQVLVLIDGIKLGDPSSTSTQFQFDHLTSLDIERIEVLRGNQSSLYGSDAIGGVINIITRRATQDGLLVNAEGEGGAYGTTRGGASVFGRGEIADFRLTAFGFRADGPSNADPRTAPGPVKSDPYQAYGVSGRLGLRFTEALNFDATGFYSLTDLDYDNVPREGSDSVEKDEYALGGRLTYQTLDGALTHEINAGLYNAERTFTTGFSRPGGDVYDGTLTRAGYIATGRPMERATVIGGVNWEREETDQLTSFSGDFSASVETRSVFGEVAVEPLDDLTFTVAGRLDDNSRFGTFDTYRLTAAYFFNVAADLDLKLRGSFGTGAKAPGLYQLFDPTFGNRNLEVEDSRGWDLGFDVYWARPRLAFEATYFRNDVTNEIAFGARPDLPGGSGYIQFGSTEAEGVELGLTAQPLSWLRIDQSYTWLLSQNGDTSRWLGRPRHTGTTGLTFGPAEQWSVTTRARYATENASGFGGVADGYVVVDLLGGYRFTDAVEFFGRVENLFDTHYQTQYGYQTRGFSVFVGLRGSFGG